MPLKTLGGLEFTKTQDVDPDELNRPFTRTKPLALLTYLTLEGEQNRSFMAKLIWGNAKKPFNSLAQAIDQLVRLLPETIEKSDTRVKALVSSDAVNFREAVREERYLDAIELYTGDFLAGSYPQNITFDFTEWLDEMANLLAEEVQIALCRQAELDLVTNTVRSKEFAERAYKVFERTQVGEANLQFLYVLLKHHGSVYASKLAQVLDEFNFALDEVELDLEKAEQAAVQASSGVVDDAKDGSKDSDKDIDTGAEVIGSSLPVYASEFFGRKEELQNLQHMLQQPECHLLTLSGPGGMGKTRLATELTHILRENNKFESVSFVALEPQDNPDQLANTIAQSLKLSLDAQSDALQQVIAFLQGKNHFMTLDNFEHLLTPDSAQVIAQLLDGCPQLNALITTRERLDIQQEWLVGIGVLNHPSKIHTDMEEVVSFDAIQLFVDRARRSNIRFQLTEDNSQTVQELIMKTAGLPLAIELAASWIQSLPPESILDELHKGLEILTSTTASNKHKSIEITFEHSWERLNDTEKAVLQGLSIFEDSFTKEAATFVTDVSFLQLMRLINKSLLQTTKSGRYVLHPLLKQYLGAKLQASGLVAEVQERHAEYYMNYFKNSANGFRTAKEGEAHDAVGLEIENIKPAWLYACEFETETIESGLVWELRRFFDLRNYQMVGSQLFAQMAELESIQDFTDLHGSALGAQAWLVHRMSQYESARIIADKARAIASESDNVSVQLNIANTQGSIASYSGENNIALNFYQKAVELAKREEGQYRLPTYLCNMAAVQKSLGNFEQARLNLEQALAIAKKQDDESVLCNVLLGLGNLHNSIGKHKEAKSYYQKALHYSERHRLEQDLSILFSNLANVNFELGLLDESKLYCEKVLNVSTIESNHRLQSAVNGTLGKIAFEREQYDKAQDCYDKALKIALDYSLPIYLLRALANCMAILLKDESRTGKIKLDDIKQWLHMIINHPKTELQYKTQTENLVKEYALQLDNLDLDNTLTVEDVANILLEK